MEYEEAAKSVASRKSKEAYLVVELNYDRKFIFPYKEGMAFMSSLVNAELLHTPYSEQHRIAPIPADEALKSYPMSSDEYERYKIAALLNVKPEEVRKLGEHP